MPKLYTSIHYGDVHFPFQDDRALSILYQVVASLKPDLIACHGDLLDCFSISSFAKDIHKRPSLRSEILQAQSHFKHLNSLSPRSRKLFIKGNHEDRLEREIRRIAAKPEALEILRLPSVSESLTWPSLLDLPALGWEFHDKRTLLFDRLILKHGNAVRKWSAYSAKEEYGRYNKSGISGHCFDEETEILTPEGWTTHEQLKEGSIVMSYNRDSGVMEWNPVEAVYRYDHFKELVHVKNVNLDLAVTGGHGLWLGQRSNDERVNWAEHTADSAFGTEKVFQLAAEHTEGKIELSDAQIRTIAWVMAEGHLESRYRQGRVDTIRIAQSDAPDGRLATLEQDLEESGIVFGKTQRYTAGETEHGQHRNFDAYRLTVRKATKVWDGWLNEYLTWEKAPTQKLRAMSARQIRIFLDTYVLADGSLNSTAPNSRQIATNRKDHADFLQELVARAGYRSSLIERPGGMYCLTYNLRNTTRVKKSAWTRQPYSGQVWCVTVPNGTLLVRRKGKAVITLNTHRRGVFEHTDWNGVHGWWEHGCLCDLDPDYVEDPNWQQGFVVVSWADDRKYFGVEEVRIHNGSTIFRGRTFTAEANARAA